MEFCGSLSEPPLSDVEGQPYLFRAPAVCEGPEKLERIDHDEDRVPDDIIRQASQNSPKANTGAAQRLAGVAVHTSAAPVGATRQVEKHTKYLSLTDVSWGAQGSDKDWEFEARSS